MDAADDTIYEVLELLGWVPGTEGRKRLANVFSCTGEDCPMKLAEKIGGKVAQCTAHHCEHRTASGED